MVTQGQAPGRTGQDQGQAATGERVRKIVVRIQTGEDRMAATDDPVYLRLVGPEGREFRLQAGPGSRKGKPFRRGAHDEFVLAGRDAAETNVAEPELNDPATPSIHLAGIERIELRKGTEPLPNVRGVGEMDDRLEIKHIEVELHAENVAAPVCFRREGPIWLGMVSGMSVSLPRVPKDAGAS